MVEFPEITRIIAETHQSSLLRVLQARFGEVPVDLQRQIQSVKEPPRLEEMMVTAATSPDLVSFRAHLTLRRPSSASHA